MSCRLSLPLPLLLPPPNPPSSCALQKTLGVIRKMMWRAGGERGVGGVRGEETKYLFGKLYCVALAGADGAAEVDDTPGNGLRGNG